MQDQRRLYNDLAWIWPIISPPEDYAEEAGEFRALIQGYSKIQVNTLLHLGCGAGHLDHHLKRHFQVTGIDLSKTMLGMAKGRNPEVEYLVGDMRSVRLGGSFDAVIIADSIDYMLNQADLRRAFQSAYQHLKMGGIFCTYAEETTERFQQNKTKVSIHTSGDIEITTVENYFDPDPSDTTFEMTFVHLIRQEGKLSIELDRHLSGLFSHAEWIETLEEVGFNVQTVNYMDAGPSFVCIK